MVSCTFEFIPAPWIPVAVSGSYKADRIERKPEAFLPNHSFRIWYHWDTFSRIPNVEALFILSRRLEAPHVINM